MLNLYARPTHPGESRGLLPLLIAAAMGVRAAVGAVQANQQKQRNKGFVNANYRVGKERLDRSQRVARQDIAESLNARGLAQGGSVSASPIHAAMTATGDTSQVTSAGPASTIGEADVRDSNEEMSLEQQDLGQQRDQAIKSGKAQYNNDLVGSGVAALNTGMEVYSAGKDIQASRASAAASRSKIHATMLSGAAYDGVHPNDPLGEPTSAWSTHPRTPKIADPMQSNGSFNALV